MPDPFDDPAIDPATGGQGDDVRLSDADRAAIDALVESGFAGTSADARTDAVRRLFASLEPHPDRAAPDPSLVDITVTRVLRAGRDGVSVPERGGLVADDGAALDSLVACEWDDDALPPRHTRRGRRIARLVSVLSPASVEAIGADDLVDRTLLRVRAAGARPMLDRPLLPMPAGSFRLADLIAVAAMLLIGLSILWPTVGAMRLDAMRTECQSGLANAGVGFALYGNDNLGRMPAVEGSIPATIPGAGAWWEVGSPTKSHSANLFVLIKQGYVHQHDLACVGNRHAPVSLDVARHDDWRSAEEVSYSYQLFNDPARRMPTSPNAVLLTDRSPLVLRAMQHEAAPPEARSPNHGGAGQNVLFGDRSVRWLIRPVTDSGDNFWLPANVDGDGPVRLEGTETPVGPDDAFVGP
ncbi:MAG: hypothetical protein ACF8QF_02470 [Phycisphaerales bacterium]